MKSENQKTNIANWYTQNGEHYIHSFGDEYEQHFTETKNTDGGCAILTDKHCYLQGKYLLEPEKKSKSCFIDEKISLHNVIKCRFGYSSFSIFVVCVLLVGWLISCFWAVWSVDYTNGCYQQKQGDEYKLSRISEIYKETMDEYNQMINSLEKDIAENGVNASCVYFLSENESIYDVIEWYESFLITEPRLYVVQKDFIYNSNKAASTEVYFFSKFGYGNIVASEFDDGYSSLWGTYSAINVASAHQHQIIKIFSDLTPYHREWEISEYVHERIDTELGYLIKWDKEANFEELESEIADAEELLRRRIENWFPSSLELRILIFSSLFVLLIPIAIFNIVKDKYFHFVYRTGTLDYKKIYLRPHKKIYKDVELFSSELKKIAEKTKTKSLTTTVTEKQRNSKNPPMNSLPDDLRKYAELLKDGIITQEEFDAMKQKILGL